MLDFVRSTQEVRTWVLNLNQSPKSNIQSRLQKVWPPTLASLVTQQQWLFLGKKDLPLYVTFGVCVNHSGKPEYTWRTQQQADAFCDVEVKTFNIHTWSPSIGSYEAIGSSHDKQVERETVSFCVQGLRNRWGFLDLDSTQHTWANAPPRFISTAARKLVLASNSVLDSTGMIKSVSVWNLNGSLGLNYDDNWTPQGRFRLSIQSFKLSLREVVQTFLQKYWSPKKGNHIKFHRSADDKSCISVKSKTGTK